MKLLNELQQIKKNAMNEIVASQNTGNMRAVVGMATCGIAAGAKPVMETLIQEIEKRNLNNVKVNMTGCIGVCRLEPIVEIMDGDDNKVTYVNMTPEKVKRVVAEHIVNGRVCLEYTIGAIEKAG